MKRIGLVNWVLREVKSKLLSYLSRFSTSEFFCTRRLLFTVKPKAQIERKEVALREIIR